MEPETSLFTMALGLEAPWYVEDVAFDAAMKQIDFEVASKAGSRFACPSCGAADQPVFDTRRRSWEHLRFFEHKAFIHAAVPRVACSQYDKTRQVTVPRYTHGAQRLGLHAAPQSPRDRAGARDAGEGGGRPAGRGL